MASDGTTKAPVAPVANLPKLQLAQPYKVVYSEMAAARGGRVRAEGKPGKPMRLAQQLSGTLNDTQLERLKHAFVALAGGDGPKDAVRPSKLREVCVLAGLDPSGKETPQLVAILSQHSRRDGKIKLDDFLRVISHFSSQY